MNILLTSIGRRVSVVNFFREALEKQGLVMAADADSTAPGLYRADKSFVVPPVNNENYISYLMEICKKNNVKLIISFIDPELPVLANAKDVFKNLDIQVLVSPSSVIDICRDKLRTYRFFKDNRIPSPNTALLEDDNVVDFPVILKPQFGSSSIGVFECKNSTEWKLFSKLGNDYVVQEKLSGAEVTIDVLCNLKSQLISMVPRKRIKVRGGEVERAVTIELDNIKPWIEKIVSALQPIGPLNIQCFLTDKGPMFTEINPRFGGGYPLAHFAGADFPRKIIKLIQGIPVEPSIDDYEKGLIMMRYDDAVYMREDKLCSG